MIRKIPLSFKWKYSPDFKEEYILEDFNDEDFTRVNIPHTNIVTPYNNFDERIYQFESSYRKKFWQDGLEEGQRVYIKFEAVMTYARVYLNGNYLGDHKGGYTAFRLDLTDFIKENSNNILLVYVDSKEREDIPPFGFVVDYLTYGGIYREVTLEYYNDIHIKTLGIKTRNVLSDEPNLDLDLHMRNHSQRKVNLGCKIKVLDRDEELVARFEKEISLKGDLEEKIQLEEIVKNIRLWDLDSPNLYSLRLDLFLEGRLIGQYKERFGFRDLSFTEKGFYLNGRKVKLKGLNRHQSFPYVGYAMPKSAQYKDAEILKYDLGLNIVRLSHYPQSRHFLDRCDEIGLLVFDEIPGWQHVGDEEWQDLALENVREMILEDMNHPSIIIWGVRINESQDYDKFYEKTNKLARELDKSRPTGGVRCIANSNPLEDIYTYNDFIHSGSNRGLEKKKKITKSSKPYLVTEYNGHMFPTKKFDNESRRIQHALRHLNVLETMEGDEEIIGAIGWSMFDYNTHKDFGSGDKICYHGVMDMFRIEKYAAYVYKSQGSKKPVMKVASSFNIGEYDGSLLEDIYVFTNCDKVKLYKNDHYINTFYPRRDIYPNLPHPPIIIDDLVGDAIKENENFSPKDSEIIKELLIKASKKGANLGLLDSLKMARLFLKYRMNMAHAEALYTKYFGGWGGQATHYKVEGYMGETPVLESKIGQVMNPSLLIEADEVLLLEEESYDSTRIIVRLVDDYGNDIIYGNDSIVVETEGPIELIGPKHLSLIGGSIGFWVKSIGEEGKAKLRVKSERFPRLQVDLKVENLNKNNK